jgi:hypothetical protein
MEKRSIRQYSQENEYLYAIKEDLSEWLDMLYPHISIDPENFLEKLETGEILMEVRNKVPCIVAVLRRQTCR